MTTLETLVQLFRAFFQSAQARDADVARQRREWAARTRAERPRNLRAAEVAEDDVRRAQQAARDVEGDLR